MSKNITIEYNDTSYTLEFTRRSVAFMEKNGFRLDDLKEAPVYTTTELFAGAFVARHRALKRDLIDKIYDAQRQKKKLLEALIDMYLETVDVLNDEENDEEDEEETPTWRVNQ